MAFTFLLWRSDELLEVCKFLGSHYEEEGVPLYLFLIEEDFLCLGTRR